MDIGASISQSYNNKGPIHAIGKMEAHKAKDGQQISEKSGDGASMSHDGLLFTEALRTAQNAPDMRMDKVESLKAKIANGTYQIDSAKIAQCLVAEEAGLFLR